MKIVSGDVMLVVCRNLGWLRAWFEFQGNHDEVAAALHLLVTVVGLKNSYARWAVGSQRAEEETGNTWQGCAVEKHSLSSKRLSLVESTQAH